MITVTNIVDLIIDKKVKELESLKQEKQNIYDVLKKEENDFYIDFLKNLFNDNFKKSNSKINHWDERRIDGGDKLLEYDYLRFAFGFKMMGLVPKNYENKTDAVYDEIETIEKQITEIKNSKDSLIAEVTLQHLSSIDIDFEKNIEALTEKIFNTLPQLN